MSVYDKDGNVLSTVFDAYGNSLSAAYDSNGNDIFSGSGSDEDYEDYDVYATDYQHTILQARDEWKVQYRNDSTVIPIVLHTDEHGDLTSSHYSTALLFKYLNLAINWDEVSACVGLGDTTPDTLANMERVLNYIPYEKNINMWGNHDLWANYTTDNGNYVIDWDSMYFDNSEYGDVSECYDHKYNEYHVDIGHNIKYVCIAGWEIDSSFGGDSHYIIGTQSMDNIIEMLEMEDGYDIVLMSHCTPFTYCESAWFLSPSTNSGDGDAIYDEPVERTSTGALTSVVSNDVSLDEMLAARNAKTSGTITDAYGVEHSYDFTNCTGNILCSFVGHKHRDCYGYSLYGGILTVVFDAFGYETNPFYLINIDRTNGTLDCWKITDDAEYYPYSIPITEA